MQGRQKLKEFIREAGQLDGNLFVRFGKIAAFLAGTKVIGKLDFSERSIAMRVKGMVELGRLSAVRKEPETVQWIRDFVKPGDIFYDIGANVGAYSLVVWAATGGRAKIYAFEPGTPTFVALKENILLNDASGAIKAYQTACTEKTGTFNFHYRSKEPGGASHVLTEYGERPDKKFQPAVSEVIKGWALDDFIAEFRIAPPTHMKIDVDGAELAVIKGAEKTLKYGELRSILVEIDEKHPGAEELTSRIRSAGLVLHSKHQRGSASKRVRNYIFVRE